MFRHLDARLRSELNRYCYEPPGQDGFSCLLLAVLHQLEELGLPDVGDAARLRAETVAWMLENQTFVLTFVLTFVRSSSSLSILSGVAKRLW